MFKLVELIKPVRQDEKTPFASMLLCLRTNFLNRNDLNLIQSRVTNGLTPIDLSQLPFCGALHLYRLSM